MTPAIAGPGWSAGSPVRRSIEAPFRDEFERPGGTVSGPVFMAAADVAIWLAVVTRRGTGETWVTADLKTAFLRRRRMRAPGRNPLTHHTGIDVRIPDEHG